MIPMVKRLVDKILHDELAVRRWSRAVVMGLALGGTQYADQVALVLGDGSLADLVRKASIIAGVLSVAITAGERNPRPAP